MSLDEDPRPCAGMSLAIGGGNMKHIVIASLVSLTLGAGCSKKSQCEEIFDHTVSLLPAELKDKVAASKSDAIGKCEKLPEESKKCALAAQSMEDLMKCPK